MTVHYMPEGYSTLTPYLLVKDAAALIRFLTEAFGAQELFRMPKPDGTIGHAELQLGSSRVMLSTACEQWGPTTAMYYLYLPDVDAAYQRALAAGASSEQEPKGQFYGDRSASVRDASGNLWCIGTHVEDVAPDELERRAKAAWPPGQSRYLPT